MHKLMVGVRIDAQGETLFFGWDEVNEYLRHGMRVVALEPGEAFVDELETASSNDDKSNAWYFTVILDDHGIDPA